MLLSHGWPQNLVDVAKTDPETADRFKVIRARPAGS